jgi:O-antigen/teichoic acid export membrane protein
MLKNGLYNLLGTGVKIGLGIVSVPILFRLLGTEGYGLYSILISIIAFAVLSEWSISLTLNVFLSQDLAQDNADKSISISATLLISLFIIIGLAMLTTGILWSIAPFLPKWLKGLSSFDAHNIVVGCRLLILIVWPRLLHQYFIGIEQAYNKYALLNIITIGFNITQTVSILLMAYLYKTIFSILIAQIVISTLFVFVHAIICYRLELLKHFSIDAPITISRVKYILGYSSRIWLGTIGSILFNQGDRLVIGNVLTPSAVGIYSAITSLVYQINSFSATPVQPLMTIVSQTSLKESLIGNDSSLLLISVLKALLLNVLISIGMGAFILLFSNEIVTSFFHVNTIKNQTIFDLKLIAIIYTLYSMNAVGFFILYAIKKETMTTLTTLLCGLLALLLISLLSTKYGLTGAILGNSIYILTLFLLYKGLTILKIPWNSIFNIVKIPILLFIITLILAFTIDSFFYRCLSAIFLFFCFFLFGTFKLKELLQVPNGLNNSLKK